MRSRILFATIGGAVLAAAALAGSIPSRGEDDAAQLSVTVASVEPCGKTPHGAIVTLKVANKGASFAEPLTFEIVGKDRRPVVLRRAPGPYVRRSGRSVPPGGTQTYPLLFDGEHALLAGAKCKVADVAFRDSAPPAEPPVVVGKPRSEKRKHELGGTVEIALLPLENLRDVPVDVTVRAMFERPISHTILVHRRLGPREKVEASFTDVALAPPPAEVFTGEEATLELVAPRGARIASAKLVDWCAVEPDSGIAASTLLREAYADWLRWDTDAPGVRGTFRAELQPKSGAARASHGAFGASARGAVSVQPEGVVDAADQARIERAVAEAFADLVRPDADEAVALCKPRIERKGPPAIVACEGESWSPEYRSTRFAIEGGRIVGHAWSGGAATDTRCEWTTETFEGGYVVAERRSFYSSARSTPTEVRRWRYTRVAGILVPGSFTYAEDLSPQSEPWSLSISFHDIERDSRAAAPVASPAMETVRAAWNTGYRHPAEKIACACRFTVKPGKDAVWRGVKEAKGRITFADYDGRARGRATIAVEGVADEALRRTLSFAVDDRFGLWEGRDFAARGEFDLVFAGASFAERAGQPGCFDVSGGPYRSVTVRDGRIATLSFDDGRRRTLTWTKVQDHDVVTRIVTGEEDLMAEYTRVGPLLVPSRLVFKGVFGDEKAWGTEDLRFTEFVGP